MPYMRGPRGPQNITMNSKRLVREVQRQLYSYFISLKTKAIKEAVTFRKEYLTQYNNNLLTLEQENLKWYLSR